MDKLANKKLQELFNSCGKNQESPKVTTECPSSKDEVSYIWRGTLLGHRDKYIGRSLMI